MINVVSKRCKFPDCDTVVHNEKYDNYCLRCFTNLFPDHPKIPTNYLTKEITLRKIIKEKLPDYEFIFNKIIDQSIDPGGENDCPNRVPDIFIDLFTHIIIMENDENQHNNREQICEDKRSMILFQNCANRPMVILRFNPDKYIDKDQNKHPSCFAVHKHNGAIYLKNHIDYDNRVNILVERFLYHVNNIPEKEFIEEKLFYNGYEK